MKKSRLNGYVNDFLAEYESTGISNIVKTQKYLMKKA